MINVKVFIKNTEISYQENFGDVSGKDGITSEQKTKVFCPN